MSEDIEDLFEDEVAEPIVSKPAPQPVPAVKKSEISKLIKDVLTTRKSKPPEHIAAPIIPEKTTEKLQVEKMFSPPPPKPPKPKPTPVKTQEKPPVPPEIAAIIAQEMESKPIQVGSKKQKVTFGQKLKSLFGINRIRGKIKSKERDLKTGLTARQRIKRYNSIHEGGYGVPIGEKIETNGSSE